MKIQSRATTHSFMLPLGIVHYTRLTGVLRTQAHNGEKKTVMRIFW